MTPIELGAVGLVAVLIVREFVSLLKGKQNDTIERSLLAEVRSHVQADANTHSQIVERLGRIEQKLEAHNRFTERLYELELKCARLLRED